MRYSSDLICGSFRREGKQKGKRFTAGNLPLRGYSDYWASALLVELAEV